MKKVLLVSALVMTIVTSMVSGSLAIYNVTLEPTISGPVNAAEFKLTVGEEENFTTGVSIAPSEFKDIKFSVSNKEGAIVSEVAMGIKITVELAALANPDDAEYIGVITPLTAEILDEHGDPLKDNDGNFITISGGIDSGVGTFSFADELTDITAEGDTKIYTVRITWTADENKTEVQNNEYDTTFAGHLHGTELKVTVEGTQK